MTSSCPTPLRLERAACPPASGAPRVPAVLVRRLVLPVVCLAALVLLAFAVLRETPSFWLAAGGYPAWLREWVAGFGWLLFAQFLCLGWLAFSLVTAPGDAVRPWLVEASLLALAGLLWAAALGVVVANNVTNLLAGRPLHHHAPAPSSSVSP